MKHILIFGGGGFLGGNVAFSKKSEGNWVRIADKKVQSRIPLTQVCDNYLFGDLRNPDVTDKALTCPNGGGFDEVYQLAGNEETPESIKDASIINENVFNSCVKHKANRVFYSPSLHQTDLTQKYSWEKISN